ncbi:very-long-chain (3R)-3-hydroxyacyl-CoA dehydratase [Nematocida minor]|uniref:very-long-chain (3R)-3-hydroxyacyl-CoA dehydratase n=1 Tax=Nematocida minor TaxID=1912983 RepID=UPI00221E648E|nr:very-long-chain (3R)-3-hydroxyacyl-CoA dehydratase [Nematocida minor]KAI5189222.1 very-long-chain (3R)-3-hydroxyacyl-CoA dehydratase [Nematocida minor]
MSFVRTIRKVCFGLFVRSFFILFGLAISWSVVSMGLDLLSTTYGIKLDRDFLYFLQGYSTGSYKKYLINAQELYSFEPLLSLLGITRQSFITSVLQIASRIFISRCACSHDNKTITGLMILVWGISDCIRFLYYAFPPLKKIRYLASLILYPIGILCEIYLMINMKNILSLIGLIVYAPGIIYLYGRIRAKRNKIVHAK